MSNEKEQEERFLKVFLRHEDNLKAYARALLPTWEAVDNVMQEASLVIWRKMDQLNDVGDFVPWAKVIVRFECLKARRTVSMDRHLFSSEVMELLADHDDGHDHEALELERGALRNCLESMEPAQRELLFMRYRDHGAIANLAAQSGRTVNSLYKRIRRIREKLSKCVSRKLSDANFCGELL